MGKQSRSYTLRPRVGTTALKTVLRKTEDSVHSMSGKSDQTMRKRRIISAKGRWAFAIALTVVFIAGLAARLLGLRLGLPYVHHWDECWIIWNTQKMLEPRAPVPVTYQYGAPLSACIAFCVKLRNIWPWGLRIAFDDEVKLRWIGRGVSAVLSSTGTLAMYVAGRNLGLRARSRSRLGLYAAVTYAMAYELVTHARYAVTDAPLAAFVAWSLASSAAFLRTRRLRWVGLSFSFATLAFGFKFTALPTFAIPVLCLMVATNPVEGRLRWVRGALISSAPVIAIGGFLLLNPQFVGSFKQAVSDLAQRMAQTRDGGFSHCYVHEPGIDHLTHVLWALSGHTLSRSVTLACVLTSSAVIGVWWAVNRWSKIMLIVTIHAMIVVVGLAVSARTLVLRNYLTAVPFMCLGVGIALERFRGWAIERQGSNSTRWLGMLPEVLLVTLTAVTLHDSVANAGQSEDSRTYALKWVGANAAANSTLSITPSVVNSLTGDAAREIRTWAGQGPRFVKQSQSCVDLQRDQPDYVVSASYRGPDTPAVDFDERWFFTACPGYRKVATFNANPYECTFSVYPTWMGRVSTVVLARLQ